MPGLTRLIFVCEHFPEQHVVFKKITKPSRLKGSDSNHYHVGMVTSGPPIPLQRIRLQMGEVEHGQHD
ncbi:MAG: hypothetical protein VYC10_04525, partial [Pseudomonadota bacterium]|nr:hypothetical protein [Pseudomonadota bacterium]